MLSTTRVFTLMLAALVAAAPLALVPPPPAAALPQSVDSGVVAADDGPSTPALEGTDPTIVGEATVGGDLAIVLGSWSAEPDLITYRWIRGADAIADADQDGYTLTAADEDATIIVEVTATKEGYTPVTLASAAAGPVIAGTLASVVPGIGGSAIVGQTLIAVAGSWLPEPGYSFQWNRDGAPIAGADSDQYLVSNDDVGRVITVTVLGTLDGYHEASRVSEPTAVVSGVLTSAVPTVAGVPGVGLKLTAKPGSWGPDSVALTYQWLRDGSPIIGATSATYVVASGDLAHKLAVSVTGTKANYLSVTRTSLKSAPVTAAFITTRAPSVSGGLSVGSVLTATTTAWSPAATFSYRWSRDGVPIDGATAVTYTLTVADAGTNITVAVTGSRTGYTATSRSSAATQVERQLTTRVPTIVGAADVGRTVTAAPGSWGPAPVTLSYQWKRDGVAIAGATAASYKVAIGDAGTKLTVAVTGKRAGYTSVKRTSGVTVVPRVFSTAPVPTIVGTLAVGKVLTAQPGAWAPTPVTLSYQWKRNGIAIAGAVGTTYKLVALDAGTSVTVVVTGSKPGYTTRGRTSAVSPVQKLLTATPIPVITGAPSVGITFTATPGAWKPGTVTFSYQWFRSGTAIPGATAATYKVVAADAGKPLTVRVTGSKSGYTSVARLSVVKEIRKVFTMGTPGIHGSHVVGRTLSPMTLSVDPDPTSWAYQWMRNGVPIPGAVSALYKLTPADEGARISYRVTVSGAGYSDASRTTLPGPVVVMPTPPGGDGLYQVGADVGTGTFITTTATEDCYWARLSDFSGVNESVIANDYGPGQRIVTIYGNEAAFLTEGCGAWTNLRALPARTSVDGEGVYPVGTQMKPGLWRSSAGTTGCYWETMSGFSHEPSGAIASYFGNGPYTLRITNNVVGFYTSGCGRWTRVAD
jgi:hypothetical protein